MKKLLFFALLLLAFAASALGEEAFAPDAFTFSGGTGRVTITCPRVRLEGEQAWATLVFSSPRYPRLRVNGREYATVCDERTSAVEVPAPLNRAFDIQATTTAMSVPHEITYTLYIRVDALDAGGVPGLVWQSALTPRYAQGFTVDRYAGGYQLIDVKDGGRYLTVPAGQPVPEGLDPAVTVIQQPVQHIYLAATSAMSLLDALDALDAVRFSSLRQEDWYVANAAEAMARGEILFAGKYDAPDYELLVREGCGMAVESTMIAHAPKIQELLELLGIPVFVDRSSYEAHPLGRTEWIKLYGALLGKEAEAEDFFDAQAAEIEALQGFENTGKTVAYFYINPNGAVVVRHPADYIPAMIALAGGRYALPEDFAGDVSGASVTVSMEEFYAAASQADYLIYNAAIDDPLQSLEQLIAKNDLMRDFRAVQTGNVWCAERSLYQATDVVSRLVLDIHHMLLEDGADMTFLRKVQ